MFREPLGPENWPHSIDPAIKKHLSWVDIALHSTLAGVEAIGLFVMLVLPSGNNIYIGPFVGMCGIYQIWSIIMQIAKDHRATHFDIVKHNIPR